MKIEVGFTYKLIIILNFQKNSGYFLDLPIIFMFIFLIGKMLL